MSFLLPGLSPSPEFPSLLREALCLAFPKVKLSRFWKKLTGHKKARGPPPNMLLHGLEEEPYPPATATSTKYSPLYEEIPGNRCGSRGKMSWVSAIGSWKTPPIGERIGHRPGDTSGYKQQERFTPGFFPATRFRHQSGQIARDHRNHPIQVPSLPKGPAQAKRVGPGLER